jgi:sporulation protein Cse60
MSKFSFKTKVHIITEPDYPELQVAVNDYLDEMQKELCELIDIKYAACENENDDYDNTFFSAMIMYKELYIKPKE